MSLTSSDTKCSTCESRPLSVFCHLEKLALEKLSSKKVANTYLKGQSLFHQGNPPFGLYCINSGKIKITKTGEDGNQTIVRIASAGDLLGHRSLFSNSPYTASATVIEDAGICFLDRKTIYELLKIEPVVSLQLINRLSQDMGRAENMIASMAQKNARERFSEQLLLLYKSFGTKEDSKCKLNIKLSREEMASMVGIAPESLIRLVTEFKQDGILSQEGKTLFIDNFDKLEEYARIEI